MSAMELREEIAFAKRRIAKRRFKMEAQGGGEVRRLHIIYFLSRKGRIEHPHLIRVHHLSRSGVRLRDVKRWLSELRGKDMPESYAWSYKRRYKTGFVWQDLVDEDLITPISDNEYVLKGSEISSTTFDIDLASFAEKEEDCTHKEPPTTSVEAKTQVFQKPSYNQHTIQEHLQTPMDNMLTKPLLEIEEEESPPFSSETSTQTDDSLKLEEENHSDATKEEENQREKCPFYSTFLNKKNKKKINIGRNDFKAEKPRVLPDSSASKSTFTKSRSYSNNNASNMFRNLITCGAVDTNDSGMVLINRRSKKGSNLDMSTYKPSGNKMAEICRGEIVGGSERISRVSWNQQQQQQQNACRKSCDGPNGSKKNKKSDMNSPKPVPAPYKPVNGPNCSQCGKTFKPDKLHAHMKSCRGMKALARGAATPANPSSHRRSTDSPPRGSISSHYLINE